MKRNLFGATGVVAVFLACVGAEVPAFAQDVSHAGSMCLPQFGNGATMIDHTSGTAIGRPSELKGPTASFNLPGDDGHVVTTMFVARTGFGVPGE